MNITLGDAANDDIVNEYMIEFISGTTATKLVLPADLKYEEPLTIEANRVNPKIVMSNSFSFDVAKNDRVAVFMKSDKNDGFYIESTTNGKPFYWSTLVFDEEKEIPKNIVDLIEQNGIQFTKAGKPVDNPDKYSISIDVDTNKITVITK